MKRSVAWVVRNTHGILQLRTKGYRSGLGHVWDDEGNAHVSVMPFAPCLASVAETHSQVCGKHRYLRCFACARGQTHGQYQCVWRPCYQCMRSQSMHARTMIASVLPVRAIGQSIHAHTVIPSYHLHPVHPPRDQGKRVSLKHVLTSSHMWKHRYLRCFACARGQTHGQYQCVRMARASMPARRFRPCESSAQAHCKPQTPNPEPQTPNPKPETLNPTRGA